MRRMEDTQVRVAQWWKGVFWKSRGSSLETRSEKQASGAGDGSVVTSTSYSCRRPEFTSQHPTGWLITPVLGVTVPSLDLFRHCVNTVHRHAHRQNSYTEKGNTFISLFFMYVFLLFLSLEGLGKHIYCFFSPLRFFFKQKVLFTHSVGQQKFYWTTDICRLQRWYILCSQEI